MKGLAGISPVLYGAGYLKMSAGQYYVYIVTNRDNAVLYTGETDDLKRRIFEHKGRFVPGFSKRYNASKLVYYEVIDDRLAAVAREKELKGWRRDRKIKLVEDFNPEWKDLYGEI
jgi:putative endonuclease